MLIQAEQSSTRARELGRQLQSLAKSGFSRFHPAPLLPLVEAAMGRVPEAGKIICELALEKDLPRLKLDEAQLGMTLESIIDNAVEAMPSGGTLRADGRAVAVTDEGNLLLTPGKYVRLSITDSGRGIPAADLPKIFDPYFTTKPMGAEKGRGLGLALCKAIVRKHRGAIMADSSPGRGTTIHVYLPIEPENQA
jgi:signal transduction histidine kinase